MNISSDTIVYLLLDIVNYMSYQLKKIANSVSADGKVFYIYDASKGWTYGIDTLTVPEDKFTLKTHPKSRIRMNSYMDYYKSKKDCIEGCQKLFKEYKENLEKKVLVRNEYYLEGFQY